MKNCLKRNNDDAVSCKNCNNLRYGRETWPVVSYGRCLGEREFGANIVITTQARHNLNVIINHLLLCVQMFVLTTLAILTLFFSGVEAEKIAVRILGTGAAGATKTDGIAATTAQIKNIMGLWLDTDGVLYAVDSLNSVVRKVVSGNHFVAGGTFNASVATTGGDSDKIPLNRPHGITGDKDYYYVSDSNHIWKYSKSKKTVSVFAGTSTQGFSGNGKPAVNAQLKNPNSLWMTANGILYIADTENYVIRRIGKDGIINLVAGSGVSGNSGDGQPATSTLVKLQYPNAVYVDSNDQVYIIDKKTRIRTVVGGIISAFAGENGFKELQLRLMMLLTLKGTVRETSTIQI